jgi:hypothetical protein
MCQSSKRLPPLLSSVERTIVEGLELVACLLGGVHAFEQRTDAGIVLSPEIVRNCRAKSLAPSSMVCMNAHVQERATLGVSVVAPGIALASAVQKVDRWQV